jgi:integrase
LATNLSLILWWISSGSVAPQLTQAKPSRGEPWSDDDYRNWRRRSFSRGAKAAGIAGARPYDLRHAYASLLLHEGRSVIEVAAQLGHAPTVCLDTYGHVMSELAGGDRTTAAEAVERARTAVESKQVRSEFVRLEGAEQAK